MAKSKPPRQTSPRISTIAAKTMNGYKPTAKETLSMAASLVSQDQTKGQKAKP
jgi:hypothetical protein